MKFSYFPGCTLKTKGVQLDTCGRKAAEALGFELCELPEWQCCGAVYPQATDEIATRLSSVRALAAADAAGQELVTLCSACHHVIKRVNGDMQRNVDIRYIQTMLGHSSINVTEIYTHVTMSKQKDILETKHPRQSMNIWHQL